MSYILFINEKLSNQKIVLKQSNEFDWLDETLQNHVADMQCGKSTGKLQTVRNSASKRRGRFLVNGGSTLRSSEAPISCLNNPSQEICCLSGAHAQDIRERLQI